MRLPLLPQATMAFKMRTACSTNLRAARVLRPLNAQAMLIRSLTHHSQLGPIVPAYFSRFPSTFNSHVSVRRFSTQKSPPVSSPNPHQEKVTMSESKPTAPEASTAAMSPTTSTNDKDNENSSTETASKDVIDDPIVYEQWGPTIDHLVKQIHSAWPSSPRPTTTATQAEINNFIAYWRSKFDKLAQEVESYDSLPQYLTTPPVSRFGIVLFAQDSGLDCPCCLQRVYPNIVLEAEDGAGLTKRDFVRAVGGYLYGWDASSEFSGPSSKSRVKTTFDGGEFNQTAGGEITWPTIYSEYELLTREEYPSYLIKKGDREWTLQEQLDDRERPLGGWPTGDSGASEKKDESEDDDLEQCQGLREKEEEKADEDKAGVLVEAVKQLDLDGGRTAPGPKVESDWRGTENDPEEVSANTAEVEKSANHAETKLAKEAGQPESGQGDQADSNDSSWTIREDAPTEYKFPAVVWDTNWLSASGEGPNGENIVFGRYPTIWLFCCPPGDFEDRVSTERFRKRRENWEEFYFAQADNKQNEKEGEVHE